MSIYEIVTHYLKQGKGGVIATIVKRVGATPQQAGSKIFIGEEGKIFGTVGGGCLEAEVWQEAKRLTNTERTKLLHFAMNGAMVADEGMICGGNVDVFLEPILPKYSNIYSELQACETEQHEALVITTFNNISFTKTLLYRSAKISGDPLPARLRENVERYFSVKKPVFDKGMIIEPVALSSRLYIFGAGHVSRYISIIAKMLDFEVVVIDDRGSFANKERFPEADEIIVDEFDSVFSRLDIKADEFVVIVTRGHSHDALVLGEVLKQPCRYVGMIGSKRKTKIVFDHLKAAGVDEKVLRAVHAPIGVDIGAETPQEIAVSIVAELIKAKRGKRV